MAWTGWDGRERRSPPGHDGMGRGRTGNGGGEESHAEMRTVVQRYHDRCSRGMGQVNGGK